MKVLNFLFHILLLFGFTLEYNLFIPGLTTRRLALVIAIITLLNRMRETREILSYINKSKLKITILLFIFCSLIMLGHYAAEQYAADGYTKVMEPHYFVLLLLYIFVFSLYCVVEFKSLIDFAKVWVGFILLESVIIYYSAINYSVRLFLYKYFFIGDDRFDSSIEFGSRVIGLGIHSSLGSVIMSSACVVLIVLSLRKQINLRLFPILYSMIVVATAFIGRTGLIVEIFLLVTYSLLVKRVKYVALSLIVPSAVVLIGISFLISKIDIGVAEKLTDWMMASISENDIRGTIEGASGSGFSSENILFGSGIMRGVIDGKMCYTDSGYIMVYNAMGVIGLFCFYMGLLFLMRTPIQMNRNKVINRFCTIAILVAFVIEYKEPYFLNYILAWVILTTMLFISKETPKIYPYKNSSKYKIQ